MTSIFDDITLDDLADRWIVYKETEKIAVEKRREIEDQIACRLNFPETFEGTENVTAVGSPYAIKIEGRINRIVNADKLIAIADEEGLETQISALFRWKPEINMTAWKAADQSITKPLSKAITAKAGRPSFTITRKD
jgi:hypothetical protein